LTGSGEYLRLPESEKILEFFDNSFPHVQKFFSTNGSSLAPWVREKIINGKSRYTIHVSMHASNAVLHKVMTRMDNFEEIVNSIRHLIASRKSKDKPQINLIFVATTLNIEDLPDFVRFANDLGVDKVICYYNYIYIPAQKYLSCFFKQGLTNKILDEAEDLAGRMNVKIDLPPAFGMANYPKPGICREPFSQIMFDSQGHALPCDASEDCSEILSEGRNFMDIWNGPYYQKLRKSLIDDTSPCFKHCLRANPSCVNDFKSHVIHRGNGKNTDINILWGDNF
jgi:MoaA/NifB/PqqE/SkfB family radical SAM enzyme